MRMMGGEAWGGENAGGQVGGWAGRWVGRQAGRRLVELQRPEKDFGTCYG